MRIDNAEFAALNQQEQREPRFVVEIDFGGEDLYFLTSHPVTGLAGANVIDDVLVNLSGTSQKLNPDKANSEIGSMSFEVLDDGLTELQRTKLSAQKGLRGKTVRFLVGWAALEWDQFILAQTQIIETVSFEARAYRFKCSDIQRALRQDIFVLKETRLSRTLEADAAEVEVFTTNGFQVVQQPDSPGGRTLAPGQKIGLLRVEAGGEKEVILYTGVEDFKFTGCVRGVLGTKPLRVEKTENSDRDSAPKVEEFVYLEMPGPMLAYALLTGSVYGFPGEYLPDHWHLGIAAEFIRTAEFTGIGSDLWNLHNTDFGLPALVIGVGKEDGKKYIEEEVMRMMGCFMPVYSDGQLGLRRMSSVLSSGGYVRQLNQDNVVEYGALEHDMKALVNQVFVNWNYSHIQEEMTRTYILNDAASQGTHGQADPLEMELRTLTASRVSTPTIRNVTQAVRDRYAGPPLRIDLTLTPDQNDLEVGDIVQVKLDNVQDYTGETEDGHLERNFEIQNIQTNWRTGQVSVDLFGSSQPASEVPPDEFGSALPADWYENTGTEISAANFPGIVSENGITRVTEDIALAGGPTLAGSVFWCGEDLTIDGGVTVALQQNVFLKVRGFLQVNGEINGVGNGLPGAAGVTETETTNTLGFLRSLWEPENLGPPGYLYTGTQPQTGLRVYYEDLTDYWYAWHSEGPQIAQAAATGGDKPQAEALNLTVTEDDLLGIPADLRGGGGSGGGVLNYVRNDGTVVDPVFSNGKLRDGGAGGNGGAGLFIVSRGFAFGQNGFIDVSGEDGQAAPDDWTPADNGWDEGLSDNVAAYAGAGAGGGPGAVYFIMDGSGATPGNVTDATLKAFIGGAPFSGERAFNVDQNGLFGNRGYQYTIGNTIGISSIYGATGRSVNAYQYAHRIQILTGYIPVEPDVPEETDNPVSLTLAELTNTPRSANSNLSTIEVGIQPPAASNFRYAMVEYREKGQAGWFEVGPASPEAAFVVPSDGTTYQVQARGVSISGKANPDGVVQEITTTKVRIPQPGGEQDQENDTPEAPAQEVVPAPPVNGLELFEQGNDTVFGGRDAKFVWRKTSVTEWFEMGQEGEQGAGSGGLDLYFRDYQVEVWADVAGSLSLVRTEWVNDPQFVYTYEKNAEDHQRENGPGAWREFELRVYCRGRQNQISPQAARLSVENVAPPLPEALTISASFRSAQIDFEPPEDLDYRDSRVWMSQTTGFTPGPENLVAQQYGGPVVLSGLTDNSTYYLRFATYDAFGQGTISSQFTVTTPSLAAGEVDGLSPWATVTDADRAFIDANLADDAIDSTKIVKLTASKIVTGTLAATEKISVEGQVESVVGDAVATLGPKSADGKTGMITYQYAGTTLFAVYSDGSAAFSGSVVITGGSGYSNLSDKPGSLADINSSEGGKLGGVQAGATVGADWYSNLSGIPSRLGDTPSTGLNLTATHLGYYDGASWTAYIDDNGDFYFGDEEEQYFKKDGAELSLGRDTILNGVDTFNGKKLAVHYYFNSVYIPPSRYSSTGTGDVRWEARGIGMDAEDSPGTFELSFAVPSIEALGKPIPLFKKARIKLGIGFASTFRPLSYVSGSTHTNITEIQFLSGLIRISIEDVWTFLQDTGTYIEAERTRTITAYSVENASDVRTLSVDTSVFSTQFFNTYSLTPIRIELAFDLETTATIRLTSDLGWDETFDSSYDYVPFSESSAATDLYVGGEISGNQADGPKFGVRINDLFFIED